MGTVTVSSDFHVEIPREARESLGIQPGQKIQVLLYNDREPERADTEGAHLIAPVTSPPRSR